MYRYLAKVLAQFRLAVFMPVLVLSILAVPNTAIAQAVDDNLAVRIFRSDGGTGTGFLVAGSNIVVTNRHVVEGAPEIFILAQEGTNVRKIAAEVVHQFREDIAVLRSSEALDVEQLILVSSAPDAGISVTAVGFPGSAEVIENSITDFVLPSVSRGIVSRVVGNSVQHDAPINPGNSGGPLLDSCEQVVGINTSRPNDSSQGIFVAISSTQLIQALRSIGVSPSVSFSACDGGFGDILKGPTALRNILLVVVPITLLIIWLFGVPTRRKRKEAVFRNSNKIDIPLQENGLVESISQYFRSNEDLNEPDVTSFAATNSESVQDLKTSLFTFDEEPDSGSRLNSRPNGRLRLTDPDGKNYDYEFHDFPANGINVGRDTSSNQIVVSDESVSRKHAVFEIVGLNHKRPVVTIRDLGSSNGTRLDREPVTDIDEVPHACTIRFGDAAFNVEIEGMYHDPNKQETITDIHRKYGGSDSRDERFSNSVFVNNSGWLLSGIDGSGSVLNIPLKGDPNQEVKLVLGRTNSDFNILHDSVSRRHAVICLKPGLPPTIVDLGSSNGTRVDGEEVGETPRTLYNANAIELGDLTLQLSVLAI